MMKMGTIVFMEWNSLKVFPSSANPMFCEKSEWVAASHSNKYLIFRRILFPTSPPGGELLLLFIQVFFWCSTSSRHGITCTHNVMTRHILSLIFIGPRVQQCAAIKVMFICSLLDSPIFRHITRNLTRRRSQQRKLSKTSQVDTYF